MRTREQRNSWHATCWQPASLQASQAPLSERCRPLCGLKVGAAAPTRQPISSKWPSMHARELPHLGRCMEAARTCGGTWIALSSTIELPSGLALKAAEGLLIAPLALRVNAGTCGSRWGRTAKNMCCSPAHRPLLPVGRATGPATHLAERMRAPRSAKAWRRTCPLNPSEVLPSKCYMCQRRVIALLTCDARAGARTRVALHALLAAPRAGEPAHFAVVDTLLACAGGGSNRLVVRRTTCSVA